MWICALRRYTGSAAARGHADEDSHDDYGFDLDDGGHIRQPLTASLPADRR